MTAYVKNHTISECLLKRFANDEGKIAMYGLEQPVPYAGQGYRKGLWRPETKKIMEDLWNQEAEANMNQIFKKVEAKKQLNQRERGVLCKFLAIHYIRSNKFIETYQRLRFQKGEVTSFDSEQTFYYRYQLRLKWLKESEIPCKFFEDVMRNYYELCARYLSKHGFEIGVAQTGEFILPDCGLVLATYDSKDIQSDGNIALLQATSAVLPLGPNHLVAFKSGAQKVKYTAFSGEEVQRANAILKSMTIKTYYSRPL